MGDDQTVYVVKTIDGYFVKPDSTSTEAIPAYYYSKDVRRAWRFESKDEAQLYAKRYFGIVIMINKEDLNVGPGPCAPWENSKGCDA